MFNYMFPNILIKIGKINLRKNKFKLLRNVNIKLLAVRTATSSSSQKIFDQSFLDTNEEVRYWNYLQSDRSIIKHITGFNENKVEQINMLLDKKKNLEINLNNLMSMSSDGNKELEELIKIEKNDYLESIENIKIEILKNILSFNEEENNKNVELQIFPGIGGLEAKLFAEELYNMYLNFIVFKNWVCLVSDKKSENSEFKSGCIYISGNSVYDCLKHEGGVHRVQRVPETEKSGRTHTSTCSVVVLSQPEPSEIVINDKDIIIDRIHSSAPGGQNVNKTESCIRIRHIPTGIIIENQTSRHQHENKMLAFERLRGVLYDLEQKKVKAERNTLIKEQMGSNSYSDKIRTYNFNQNRVTDHRIGYTNHSIKNFLKGEKELDEMIKKLKEFNKKKEFATHMKTVLQSEDFKNFEKRKNAN